ncbi:MAG: hypothetical protein NWQ54_14305 [Paraglaciecola sp.]|uniref:hypothetical protein n=1 Tax=Paraglaciecola sp. TaxID=1920173 RepID=UPI00273EDDD8|nr:hypothetical protein [Paraglaciecola sp.]MDP5033193.1 hypothetical protein [Paraglaciecola sp.]MDP5132052.1 hypothetical protein [Paraglaciecola sp.]
MITTLTEEDGESIYRLLITDVVGTYRNSHIGKGAANDLKPERHSWSGISLDACFGRIRSLISAARTQNSSHKRPLHFSLIQAPYGTFSAFRLFEFSLSDHI